MNKGTGTMVPVLPKCDICDKQAKYDAKTIHGPWAYLCETCFRHLGIGLGTGKGQKLILSHMSKG